MDSECLYLEEKMATYLENVRLFEFQPKIWAKIQKMCVKAQYHSNLRRLPIELDVVVVIAMQWLSISEYRPLRLSC